MCKPIHPATLSRCSALLIVALLGTGCSQSSNPVGYQMDAADMQRETEPILPLESGDATGASTHTNQPTPGSFAVASGASVVVYTFDDLDVACFFGATFPSIYRDLQFSDSRLLARCSLGGGVALLPADVAQFNSGDVARNLITLPTPATTVSIEASELRNLGPRYFVAYNAAGDEIDRASFVTSSETVQLTVSGAIHQVAIIDYQAQTYWDNLTVTYSPSSEPPVADAGPDQQIIVTESATLGVSDSNVSGSGVHTYEWSWTETPDGSYAAFSDPSSAVTTFTADLPGTYTAQLIVSDGLVDSAPDDVVVSVWSASEAIRTLGKDVWALQEAGTLNAGQSKSLLKMVEFVQRKLHTNPGVAVHKLNAFARQVSGLIDDGVLTAEQGDALIGYAGRISAAVEKQYGTA